MSANDQDSFNSVGAFLLCIFTCGISLSYYVSFKTYHASLKKMDALKELLTNPNARVAAGETGKSILARLHESNQIHHQPQWRRGDATACETYRTGHPPAPCHCQIVCDTRQHHPISSEGAHDNTDNHPFSSKGAKNRNSPTTDTVDSTFTRTRQTANRTSIFGTNEKIYKRTSIGRNASNAEWRLHIQLQNQPPLLPTQDPNPKQTPHQPPEHAQRKWSTPCSNMLGDSPRRWNR